MGGQTLDRHATDTTYQPDGQPAKVTVPSCKLGNNRKKRYGNSDFSIYTKANMSQTVFG